MCFRPTQIAKPIACPQCGKKISPLNGIFPKKCPFCGHVPDVGEAAGGKPADDKK